RIYFQGTSGDSGMRILCGSDTPVRSFSGKMPPADSNKSVRPTLLLLAFVLAPCLAHAYAGPGAGFAVLSSFWAIFVAFLYSFYALATWPLRLLFRFVRRRNAYG